LLLDGLDIGSAPAAARLVMASLRDRGIDGQEALADDFLRGSIASADVGPALYVAAALQVYFTRLAASLPAPSLHLLSQRGLCPCCGTTPVCGVVTIRKGPRRPLSALLALCDRLESCARRLHHLRSVALRDTPDHRGRSRRG
jgi:formate dehydrogenase maturation protein FdhE